MMCSSVSCFSWDARDAETRHDEAEVALLRHAATIAAGITDRQHANFLSRLQSPQYKPITISATKYAPITNQSSGSRCAVGVFVGGISGACLRIFEHLQPAGVVPGAML